MSMRLSAVCPAQGKTTTAEALSATLGLPIYTVKNSKYTEEDTFEGMNKVSGGSFAFKSTPFLEGYKNGGIIVLEEFNPRGPRRHAGCSSVRQSSSRLS